MCAAPTVRDAAPRRARLTIAVTTDLHMQLVPTPGACHLSQLAARLAQLRAEDPDLLLLDNGDAFQGAPLSREAAVEDAPHPMVAAMNAMGCDAMAPGNHDFDFGLPALSRLAAQADFPFLCSNLRGADGTDWPFAPDAVIARTLPCENGTPARIRVGLLGLQPPETVQWNADLLGGSVTGTGMVEAARDGVAHLRAQGADVVVVLAHTGWGDEGAVAPNCGRALAEVAGIDLLVLGHTHEVRPTAPDSGARPAILQPGAYASHLGIARLALVDDGEGWRVERIETRAEPVAPNSPPEPALAGIVAPWQSRVARAVAQPLGRTEIHLHNHLAGLPQDPATLWVAEVQRRALLPLLGGGAETRLPLLSAAAPPASRVDVPPGALTRGDVFALSPQENRLAALVVTGAELRLWLRTAARALGRIAPGETAPLRDLDTPAYHFDHLLGLDYAIDLSQPPEAEARVRIHGIAGQRIGDDDRVLVACSSHRAAGAGPFGFLAGAQRLELPTLTLQEVLEAELRVRPARAVTPGWRLTGAPGSSAAIDLPAKVRLPDPPSGTELVTNAATGAQRLTIRLSGLG